MTIDDAAEAVLIASRQELLDASSELGQAIAGDASLHEAVTLVLAGEAALRAQLDASRPTEVVAEQWRRRRWWRLVRTAWWGIGFPLAIVVAVFGLTILGLMGYAAYTIITTLLLDR